jgi:IclR family transcriptional regulator, KDG regulon repressor
VVALTATALRRGLDLLVALGSEEALAKGGIGVLRLAELVGADKSQVSRTLAVLAEHGFVDRDPETRTYRLGWRLFSLAAFAGDRLLLEAAEPVLERLVGELGETVHLSVLRGSSVLTVATKLSPRSVRAAGWVGRVVPAYCTSSGRALLLDHTPEQLAERLGGVRLRPLGPATPATLEALAARVADARALGVAVVEDEFEPGLSSVGAPVRDFRGLIVAAINVSAPRYRLADRLAPAAEAVSDAATELSRRLGAADVTIRRT